MIRLIMFVCALFLAFFASAAEFPNTYPLKEKCPQEKDDANSRLVFSYCNCTDYVAEKLQQNGFPMHNYLHFTADRDYRVRPGFPVPSPNGATNRWSDAGQWGDKAKYFGYDVSSTPAVGTVAWWRTVNPGDVGHVAYVEEVVDSETIKISEYNWNPSGDFATRTLKKGKGSKYPDGFIYLFSPEKLIEVRSAGSVAWYPASATECSMASYFYYEGKEANRNVCGQVSDMGSCPSAVTPNTDEDAHWYDSWFRAIFGASNKSAAKSEETQKSASSCKASTVKRTLLLAGSKATIVSGPGAMSSDLLGQGYLRPTAGVPVPAPRPDFVVKDVRLHTPWGLESYKYGLLESINTKAQSGNTGEGSCLAGESSTIIGHFYLSQGYKEDAHGDWRKVDSTETQCSNLKPGDTNTETKNTVISDWITTPGIYNIVYCIDHPKTEQNNGGDHAEKHESNNCSTEAVFEVTGNSYENTTNIDLVASQLQFRGTPPVYAADSIRLGAWITNAGTQGLYTDIRSSYGVSCNGSPQIQLADDGTEANLLGPGMNAWEEILSPATLPNVSGSCVATFCADSLGYINEVNKANNCTSLGFNLLPRTNLPDLITHSVGIAGGKTRVKAGDKFNPAFYIQNIGNTRPSVETRSLYQYRGPQTGNLWVDITTDGTEAKYLDPGKQVREEFNGGMRISIKGLYQLQVCADYLLQQPEISESNNCSVSGWFEVY